MKPRRTAIRLVLALVVAASLARPAPARSDDRAPMVYVHNAPESVLDRRYEYHWQILRTALERTTARWGPFVMRPALDMPEKRQAHELRQATGRITVMYLGTTQALERDLEPVRIPVDKNLGGYCVLLIRAEDQPRFSAVRTLDELRRFPMGLGLGWIDVGILRAGGFEVVTGSSYDGLFKMLVNRRFVAFPRAAIEILGEYGARRATLRGVAIEDSLILYYPLPMYFWFAKTDQGRRLAARAREGMLAMIEDGTYDRLFFAHHQAKIDQLHLAKRRVLRIENPFLVPETPFSDKRLWFDPTSQR